MSERELPKIGTAVWVRKYNKVLLGTRMKKQGYGTWALPGGHLEINETLEECILRETLEESGLEVQNVRYATFVEDISKEYGTHYITFFFIADWKSGEPIPQLEEFKNFDWFDWNKLPEPLFRPAQLFVDKGLTPFD